MRIDTQKQTLNARDESIKKLLEMLQNKGEGEFPHIWAILFKGQCHKIVSYLWVVSNCDFSRISFRCPQKTVSAALNFLTNTVCAYI
jgi:hypothetical protein